MKSSKINQVISALILNYCCFCLGLLLGWQSAMMLLLTSDSTPLNRPLTGTELSWFGSLTSLGSVITSPAVGYLLDKLGRKRCILLISIVSIVCWLIFIFTKNVEVVLFTTFVIGFTGSAMLVVPLFVSEFSEESIRGTLASGASLFLGIGILAAFIIVEYASYQVVLYIGLSTSVVEMTLLLIVKESPTLLMKKGMQEEARKSMGFYRNCHPNSIVVHRAIEKIKRSLSCEQHERLDPEEKELNAKSQETKYPEQKSFWKIFRSSRSTQRGFAVAMTLMGLSMCQGMLVVQVYSKFIFSEAVPAETLSATWCSVLLSLTAVVAGVVASYLMDLFGRRSLMLYSSVSAGFCCLLFGTQVQLHWGPDWMTPIFMYLFCANYTLGSGSVPLVLSSEIFLPDVKSILSMVVLDWYFLSIFFVIFVFNPLIGAIGLGPVFYIFSAVSFLTTAFCFFFLPETKGLSVDDIQLLFHRPRQSERI